MGGGGGDDYTRRQASQEQEKQRARYALNAAFGSTPGTAPNPDDFYDRDSYQRALQAYNEALPQVGKNKAALDKLYAGVRSNAFDAGKRAFDETRDSAARDLKFALFAQGLNGGSVDVDQNALLGRTYDKGMLDLGAKADLVKADMRGNDEQTRLGLLQSIDAGMDQSSALTSALQQMRVNADKAAAQAQGTTVGDLFADAGLLYTKSNAARGRQAADQWWMNNYPSGLGRRNAGVATGIITQT